jgi:hypothetical protein
MKVKVLKPFLSLADGVEYKAGDVFECTPARFKEISEKLPEWVEEIKESTPKATAKKTAKETSKKTTKE